jgi:hypothetical protein
MNHLDPADYGLILVFALRYALRRNSSSPSFVAQQVRDSWDHLPGGVRETLRRELQEFVDEEDRHWPESRHHNYDLFRNLLDWTH